MHYYNNDIKLVPGYSPKERFHIIVSYEVNQTVSDHKNQHPFTGVHYEEKQMYESTWIYVVF